LSVHAEYAWYLANDRADAERDIREAVRRAPFDFEGRKNLIVLLIATNQFDEARSEIMRLERMNLFGMFDKVIAQLQSALAKQRGEQTAE
jgi:Flp pilus assembly protein TadD